MIFVTVGVSKPFDRLIKKMDQLAVSYEKPIVMQTGYEGYKPRNTKYFETLNHPAYLAYLQQADLVISHAGTGTTMDLILHQKRCILVPRMAKYGEHINDHQLEHVKGWGDKLNIKIVFDVDELDYLVHHTEEVPVPTPREFTRDRLVKEIQDMMLVR